MLIKNNEEEVYQSVLTGELEIDDRGQIWRVAARRWDRWNGGTRIIPCLRRRAEHDSGTYLQVRVMTQKVRVYAMAHRLVWRHYNGPIPDGLTINHKWGDKQDNRPEMLELATLSEQQIHAHRVLGKRRQEGEKNNASKLTREEVDLIRVRRALGEPLKSIAASFGVSDRTISKIARNQRWLCSG